MDPTCHSPPETNKRGMALTMTGWWLKNNLEKYESQWEGLSHILWKSGFNSSEKYENQLGSFFPIYGKQNSCSKPSTR
jgi:hypothetical protein